MGYINFFDDWALIARENLEREMGQPRYVPEGTLEDPLCEGTWDFPLVAYHDGKYIGLYGAAPSHPEHGTIRTPSGTDSKVSPRAPIVCYAESEDGIHWKKPDLRDAVSFEGSVRTPNQVFGLNNGVEGGPATYDPHDPDPNRRFKLLINYEPSDWKETNGALHQGCRGLVTSPDGKNWTIAHVFYDQKATDTPTSVFYNQEFQHYTFNVRQYAGDRRVFFFHTKDFTEFTRPELVMHPDPQDPPLVGFYGMPVFPYEDMYIGLLWRIFCDPASNNLPNGGIDAELCYSYDGLRFNRTYRRAFIPRNELGEHGGGCVYTGSMLVTPENRIHFYSGGSKAEHFQNQELTDAALMLHDMRLDGFMYLKTHAGDGRMRTRAFYITGDDLRINIRCPWGEVRAQLLDEDSNPLDGFTFDDCVPFQGDDLFWSPNWNGKHFGQACNGKRRQLELKITTGEVYAIRGDFVRLKSLWDTDPS
ncbi:hypothetical protein KS4_13100 [Poriferisphaera corsica]|uniref:Glycosyl hydrolase family 32 N-terminal domain-containing protein n=1 Tax=Poriferisphaera corsica TaxID=2528020 RepID=A0A517YSQ0_9BACT|nr:hypothetical protein [Poriferisphaera corsica]QDU33265.1 hypothetical protein KS4_13100 [Poriferisphaera corsica]